jgi:type I restriction enzyme S subunit
LHYYEEGTVPWFGPSSFGNDLILTTPVKMLSETAVEDKVARLFCGGSTLIITIGATIGKVGYIESPASSNQQITAVTFDARRIAPKYAAYQLKRLEPVLRGIAPNTTLPIMDQNEVAVLPLAVPPFSEQHTIAAFLDHETSKIDALIGKVRDHIERLREFRAALITAAVTGRVDVRGEVVRS